MTKKRLQLAGGNTPAPKGGLPLKPSVDRLAFNFSFVTRNQKYNFVGKHFDKTVKSMPDDFYLIYNEHILKMIVESRGDLVYSAIPMIQEENTFSVLIAISHIAKAKTFQLN